MNKTLHEVITNILTYYGAEVEKTRDGCLDVIVPPEVSKILNIPEYARLSFSYGETYDNAIYASYNSEFFGSIKNLFASRGRFAIASFEPYTLNIEKLSKVMTEKIVFRNATFRLDRTETSTINYLLLFFRYTALSDEKHEGVMPLLINETNLSIMPLFGNSIDGIMEKLKEAESTHPPFSKRRQGWIKVFQVAYAAATQMVQERLKDFVKSLERRLNRDVKRVYEYYETLKDETKTAIMHKAISAEGPTEISRHDPQAIEKLMDYFKKGEELIWRQIEERINKDEGVGRLLNKLNAIEAEQKWKITDLIGKYALSIQVEPVAALSIETQAPVFWINIKRRLASRQFPFTYNPIVRQFDILPCEACFALSGGYYICDDKLHIVCGRCFTICPHCRKQYCRACYKGTCPKCKKN